MRNLGTFDFSDGQVFPAVMTKNRGKGNGGKGARKKNNAGRGGGGSSDASGSANAAESRQNRCVILKEFID